MKNTLYSYVWKTNYNYNMRNLIFNCVASTSQKKPYKSTSSYGNWSPHRETTSTWVVLDAWLESWRLTDHDRKKEINKKLKYRGWLIDCLSPPHYSFVTRHMCLANFFFHMEINPANSQYISHFPPPQFSFQFPWIFNLNNTSIPHKSIWIFKNLKVSECSRQCGYSKFNLFKRYLNYYFMLNQFGFR